MRWLPTGQVRSGVVQEQPLNHFDQSLVVGTTFELDRHGAAIDVHMLHPAMSKNTLGQHIGWILSARGISRGKIGTMTHTAERSIGLVTNGVQI